MAVSRDVALQAVESAIPNGSVSSLRRLPHGTTNAIFEVEVSTKESPVMLKVCGKSGNPERFHVEPAIQQLVVSQTPVPAPEVVHVDVSGRHVDRPFFLMEKVFGKNVEQQYKHFSTQTKQKLVRACGRHLSALHRTTTFGEFGTLERTEAGIRARLNCASWYDLFCRFLRRQLSTLEETRFADLIPKISALEIDQEQFRSVDEPVLVHRDFRFGNLLVSDGVQAVLDWEFAVAGDGEFDLVKAETNMIARFRTHSIATRLREHFYSAYLDGDTLSDGFPIRREYYRLCPLLEAMGAFEYWATHLRSAERRHNADHYRREVIETIRRIEAAEPEPVPGTAKTVRTEL